MRGPVWEEDMDDGIEGLVISGMGFLGPSRFCVILAVISQLPVGVLRLLSQIPRGNFDINLFPMFSCVELFSAPDEASP